MASEENPTFDQESMLNAWIRSASDFWGTMLQTWTRRPDAPSSEAPVDSRSRSRSQESFESVLKTWRTLSSVTNDPGASEAISNIGRAFPEILQKVVQAGWQGVFHLQQQWLEKAGRIGSASKAYDFDSVDEETFRTWTRIYEEEFRQFFNVPQLGLMRVYQEKINQTLDKFYLFQTTFSEFLYLFYLPMDKSFKLLQEETGKMAESGDFPDDYNIIYKLWIKILEGQYMSLYQSPEYVETMAKTLQTLEQFLAARESVMQDVLKSMAIPTQDDLDELFKEIYQLKKRLRILEKKG